MELRAGRARSQRRRHRPVNHTVSHPSSKHMETSTYDVVVLAAHGPLRAGRGDLTTDDSDRVALESDLTDDVLYVDAESGEKGRTRSRVGLHTEPVSVLHI